MSTGVPRFRRERFIRCWTMPPTGYARPPGDRLPRPDHELWRARSAGKPGGGRLSRSWASARAARWACSCPTARPPSSAIFGILKAGGTVVNFNPLYAIEEIKKQIEDSETDILVTPRPVAALRQGPRRPRRDPPEPSGGLFHGGDAAAAQGVAVPHRQAQGDRQRSERFPPRVPARAHRQCRQSGADRGRPRKRHRGAFNTPAARPARRRGRC